MLGGHNFLPIVINIAMELNQVTGQDMEGVHHIYLFSSDIKTIVFTSSLII